MKRSEPLIAALGQKCCGDYKACKPHTPCFHSSFLFVVLYANKRGKKGTLDLGKAQENHISFTPLVRYIRPRQSPKPPPSFFSCWCESTLTCLCADKRGVLLQPPMVCCSGIWHAKRCDLCANLHQPLWENAFSLLINMGFSVPAKYPLFFCPANNCLLLFQLDRVHVYTLFIERTKVPILKSFVVLLAKHL